MSDQEKSKAELIKELQELRQVYQSLKIDHEKENTGQLLHDVQNLAKIGLWKWDSAADQVTWSDELFQIVGLDSSLPAPSYADHHKIYTQKSWNILQAAVENALDTGENYQLELEMLRPDGTIRNVVAYGGARFNASHDKIIGLYGLVQDETEHKKTENALRESEVNFEKVINTMIETFSIINGDGNFIFANARAAYNLAGGPPADVIGKSIRDFVPPGQADRLIEAYNKVISTKQPVTVERKITLGGCDKWFLNTLEYIQYGSAKMPAVLSISLDISENKKAEEALLESEEKFRVMAKLLPQIIFEADVNGNLTYVNENAYKLFGYPEDYSILGKSSLDLYTPESRIKAVANISKKVSGNLNTDNNEYEMVRKDGSTFPVLVYSTPIIKEGKALGLRGIIVDITKRKNAEEELIKAKEKAEESDRLKSAFLANMSHEIRTPMNGILGFANLLKQPNLSGDEQKKYICIIEQSGIRMLNTINEIIDISKIEAGLMETDIEEIDINELLGFTFQFFKPEVESKGIVFSLQENLPEEDAIIKTDKEKVEAVLFNLIKNAIKYTKSGSIVFGCSLILKGFSEKKNKLKELEFFVKDTGHGIPADEQDAVFERFVQADFHNKNAYQGSGLGLSISKAYVEMLGGHFHLQSKEGKGSTFSFTIPFN